MTKHLKLFTSDSKRQIFESSNNYLEPYVSIVEKKGGGESTIDVYYNLVPSIILTMEDSSKIKIYNKKLINTRLWWNIDISNITNMELSNKITSIESLLGCKKIEYINIPNSVEIISEYAFTSLPNLRSIAIPSSITRIGKQIFSQCDSLSSVTLTDSLTYIDETAFIYNHIQELKIIGKKDISSLLPTNLTKNLTDLYVDASLIETYETYRDSIGKSFEVKSLT